MGVNVDKPDMKFGIKMPKIGFGGKADADVDHPEVHGKYEMPEGDVKVKGKVDVDKPDMKFGVKMPKFGFGGKVDTDVDHPDVQGKYEITEGDVKGKVNVDKPDM